MERHKTAAALRRKALKLYKKASIALTDEEKANIEVLDFNLGMPDKIGMAVVTYINNDRYCAREQVLFAHQICPEHRHPSVGKREGKTETFRCRWGEVHLYVEGPPKAQPKAVIPDTRRPYFTVWHEIVLKPGSMYTLKPNTLHWFQAGPQGAVLSEFSSQSIDEKDVFTDPAITRRSMKF